MAPREIYPRAQLGEVLENQGAPNEGLPSGKLTRFNRKIIRFNRMVLHNLPWFNRKITNIIVKFTDGK